MQDANRGGFVADCLIKADGNKVTAVVGALAHTSPRFVFGFVFHIARSPKHTADAPNRGRHTEPRIALPSSYADETRVLSLQL